MASLMEATCPFCRQAVPGTANFCPFCGRQLRYKPLETTIYRQALVYLVSFFLPPFGLWYARKYLKQSDRRSKRAGWAAVILTVLSLVLTLWAAKLLMDAVNQQIQSLGPLLH